MKRYFKVAVIIPILSFLLCTLSFAYSIEWPYIQYRTHENEELDSYRGFFDVTKNGMPVEEAEIYDLTVRDSGDNEIGVSSYEFFEPYVYYSYNCRTGTCIESGPSLRSGFNIYFEGDLSPGSYWFKIETVDGQVEKYVYYFGRLELPMVSSASMSSRYDEGNLVLNWTNPINQNNWDKVAELRVLLLDEMRNVILYLPINRDETSITIPAGILDTAESIHGTTFTGWYVVTRAYDANGMDYARGYSEYKVHDTEEDGSDVPDDTNDEDGDSSSSSGCFVDTLKPTK